jgi:hypothetical protein
MYSRRVDTAHPATAGETLDAAVRRNVASILLERRGVRVLSPDRDIRWMSAPSGELALSDALHTHTFVALGVPPESGSDSRNRDLYRLNARVTPFGLVFDDSWIVNLTQTSQADDSSLTITGDLVATLVVYQGIPTAIEVRDFSGEDPKVVGTEDWGAIRKAGNIVTNLETTGQRDGLGMSYYALNLPPSQKPTDYSLWIGEGKLVFGPQNAAEPLAIIDLSTHEASGRIDVAHLPTEQKMKYDFLNWLADRGRGLANQGLAPQWAGSGIEMMKEVYFKAQEVKADIAEAAPEPEPVPVEAPEVVEEAVRRARLQAQSSNLPWPPPPIEPMLEDRIQGEGIWKEVPTDRVTHQPNAPAPFYTTFLRPDPEYRRKKVWIAVWDPAQVSLKMRAGTSNPVPQTGHRGDGRIPRDPEHLKRVVGGFNGGFQTAHIWYGMMVDKKVLLRPREYGATAGSWADGRTAFGTWEPRAPIPDDLTHYRQNLTPLIEDGVFNPYRRRTWGWHKNVAGAVHGMTIRSSLCYTYDGFIMYLYSEFQNEHGLANTLFHVGCRYAIHLDMNKGHTGFEFYKLLGESVSFPTAEYKEVDGLTFRGTSLHPTARHMKAPTRYLGVDYRDFFYLQLRDVLPGPNLASTPGTTSNEDGPGISGQWAIDGVMHNAEFPPRVAWTTLRAKALPPSADTSNGASDQSPSIEIIQLDQTSVRLAKTSGNISPTETLMLSVPYREHDVGPATLELAGYSISGVHLGSGDDTPTNAIIAATDTSGHGWLLVLNQASTRWARDILSSRGITNAVLVSLTGPRHILKYQPTSENEEEKSWIEAELNASDGSVLTTLTNDGARLVLSSSPKPERVVRLFPNMRPKTRKQK